jgi:hypothetical protein
MGLSFHYSGTIRNTELISPLIEEAEDICNDFGWICQIIDDNKLKGICISPPESEPLFLTFEPGGRLCSPAEIMVNEPADPFYYTIHTKTQFAGPTAHMALLRLFKYLGDKYFSELIVDDEGLYWGTWDEKVLLAQFEKYNSVFNLVANILSGAEKKPGETTGSLVDRLEKLLKEKLDKPDPTKE